MQVTWCKCVRMRNKALVSGVCLLKGGTGHVQVTWCRTEDCIRRVQECGANEPTFNPEACKVGAMILLLFTPKLLAAP